MDLATLSDKALDAAHMKVQKERAQAEAGFKKEASAIQAERDRRATIAAVALVPDEVKAAILSGVMPDKGPRKPVEEM